MPELYVKQPGVTYSVYGTITKYRERIPNLEKQVIKNICIEMNWIKLFFAHDAAYSDSKDLAKKLFQIRFWKIEL